MGSRSLTGSSWGCPADSLAGLATRRLLGCYNLSADGGGGCMAHTRVHNTGDEKYSAQYNNLVLEYTNLTEPASHSQPKEKVQDEHEYCTGQILER